MPLKSGSSKKVISSNIGELIRTFKAKGQIGTSKPENAQAAKKQAIAIAFARARKNK